MNDKPMNPEGPNSPVTMRGKNRADPLAYDADGNWYFYDETWCERYGPYGSEEEASAECAAYARKL